jgi:hypothetical protein
MFNHLGYYLQGGSKGGVGLCAKVRLQVKTLFARCGGNVPFTLDDAQSSGSFPNLVNDMSLGFLDDSFIVTPKQMMQIVLHCLGLTWMIMFPCQMKPISLQEGMNSTMKQNLDKKWATLFYEANIPFNVAYHLAFINAMRSTFKGKIFYKLLLYH